MKRLKTENDEGSPILDHIEEELFREKEILHPNYSLHTSYKDKTYNCGCGKFHELSTAYCVMACRGGKGFILFCETFATLVVVEGIFTKTVKSIWTAERNITESTLYQHGLMRALP